MSFDRILAQKTALCDTVLDRFLPRPEELSDVDRHASQVVEAMRYSVMAGGKRLRPMILMETCEMYGGRMELAEPFMAALEMIHTYSLVHDDLPAMDNDEYRRGRKTTWCVYGEGMAVLTGDALLNYACETALTAFDDVNDRAESRNVISALQILMRGAGIYGMIGGQCADLEAEKDPGAADADDLLYIHKHKTACMLESAFQIGAVLADAPSEDIELLGKIGENIGIAFQIQDDILDVTGSSEELGKMTGSDEKDNKLTYVSMHGLSKARRDVKRISDEALEQFDHLSERNDFLRALIESLITRTK